MWRIWVWTLVLLAAAGWSASFHLAGTLGEQHGVQMVLTVSNGTVRGSLWDDAISERQPLAGTVADSRATVRAGAAEDLDAGVFTGTLAQGGRQFNGTWTSVDGETTLPFRFTALAEYRTLSATGPHRAQTATYPVFFARGTAWQRLNRLIADMATAAQRRFRAELPLTPPVEGVGFSQDVHIEVAYADATLASLLTTEAFDTGGAHPGLVYRSANYAITGATPRQLTLGDLFDPKTTYRAMLLELVVADINTQKTERGAPPVPAGFSLSVITIYTLSPTALTFHFAPDVAGAYAEGSYAVIFPYGSIEEYLNPRGPLRRFADAG